MVEQERRRRDGVRGHDERRGGWMERLNRRGEGVRGGDEK